MNGLYEKIDACVMCASRDLALRVPLRPIPIATPNFSVPAGVDPAEARRGVPLDLYQCARCGHVQVGAIGNPEFQYRDYVYTTSLSLGLREHFRRYADSLLGDVAPQSLVVEIGSNDGSLLRCFKDAGARVQGVDPARRIAEQATAAGVPTMAEFFGAGIGARIRAEQGPASLIIANNVIANIPDLIGFAKGIAALLADDGRFVFETQYGPDVIEKTLVDTIYHEHISYFWMKATDAWLRAHGLEAIDVLPIPTKGGSMRVFAQRAGGPHARNPNVDAWIAAEERKGSFAQPYFDQLTRSIDRIREELHRIVAAARAEGRDVAGFGVSVGTSTMLAQFALHDGVAFLTDDDPNKEREMAGPDYRIPVLPPAALLERRPAACIVFAWRYADPIVEKHADYLEAGGRFVVPLPDVRSIGPAIANRS